MKRLPLIFGIVLVSLAGVAGVSQADPAMRSILYQLQSIQDQLTVINNAMSSLQTTDTAINSAVSSLKVTVNAGVPVRPRRYYLTVGGSSGGEALAACATGFHMASLFEILDPTQLQYDSDPGRAFHPPDTDQGAGPPTSISGWVRTGSLSALTGGPGGANCFSYSSSSSSDSGTAVFLSAGWSFAQTFSAPTQVFRVTDWWVPLELPCSGILPDQGEQVTIRVWCVED